MMILSSLTPVAMLLAYAKPSSSFGVSPILSTRCPSAFLSPKALQSSQSPNEENASSRIAGNQREPTPAEINIMDEMITKLANVKPYELPNAVSRAIRVVSSPRFFMRIAERADTATDDIEKEKLSALSANLVSTIEAVVSTADDRMDETSKNVERILKAASEDDGEFLVPLSGEKIEAVREVIRGMDSSSLDEGFLTTVDAWMKKSIDDGLDGMVVIMQKLLQGYAGVEIARARLSLQTKVGAAITGKELEEVQSAVEESQKNPAAVLLDELLDMDTDLWDASLRENVGEGCDISARSLMGEVQRTIEGVVLGLDSGSMAQRVQAEYLRELVSRIEQVE